MDSERRDQRKEEGEVKMEISTAANKVEMEETTAAENVRDYVDDPYKTLNPYKRSALTIPRRAPIETMTISKTVRRKATTITMKKKTLKAKKNIDALCTNSSNRSAMLIDKIRNGNKKNPFDRREHRKQTQGRSHWIIRPTERKERGPVLLAHANSFLSPGICQSLELPYLFPLPFSKSIGLHVAICLFH
jgi:hypothetical protein